MVLDLENILVETRKTQKTRKLEMALVFLHCIKIVTGTLMFIQQEQQKTLQFHSIPPITPTAQLKRQSYISQVL